MAGPEEAAAYEELRAQLLAEHPRHLPLLLERVRRLAKLEGDARDAAALQVCRAGTAPQSPVLPPCKQVLDSGGRQAGRAGLLAPRGRPGAATEARKRLQQALTSGGAWCTCGAGGTALPWQALCWELCRAWWRQRRPWRPPLMPMRSRRG